MPGPQKVAKSNPQTRPASYRKPKIAKALITPSSTTAATVTSVHSEADDDPRPKHFSSTKKVRLICMDPDATESSSDEERQKVSPKRIVAEVILPADLFFFSSDSASDSDDEERQSFMQRQAELARKRASCVRRNVSSKKRAETKMASLGALTYSRSKFKMIVQSRYHACPTECEPLLLGSSDEASEGVHEQKKENIEGSINLQLEACLSSSSSRLVVDTPQNGGDSLSCLSCDTQSQASFSTSLSMFSTVESSIASTEIESTRVCLDIDRRMSSPSSVLENMVSEDCDSPVGLLPDKAPLDAWSDGSALNLGPSLETSLVESASEDTVIISHADSGDMHIHHSWKPEISLVTESSPLFEEPALFFGDLGQIFDIDHSANNDLRRGSHHSMDSFDDFIHDGSHFSDMNFELDPEALAWINVPMTCGP